MKSLILDQPFSHCLQAKALFPNGFFGEIVTRIWLVKVKIILTTLIVVFVVDFLRMNEIHIHNLIFLSMLPFPYF
jgi:hypothetical protein